MSRNKREVEELVDCLRRQGWGVSFSGHMHWRLTPPDKKFPVQFISYTPSDSRAIKNMRCQLRKAGAKL